MARMVKAFSNSYMNYAHQTKRINPHKSIGFYKGNYINSLIQLFNRYKNSEADFVKACSFEARKATILYSKKKSGIFPVFYDTRDFYQLSREKILGKIDFFIPYSLKEKTLYHMVLDKESMQNAEFLRFFEIQLIFFFRKMHYKKKLYEKHKNGTLEKEDRDYCYEEYLAVKHYVRKPLLPKDTFLKTDLSREQVFRIIQWIKKSREYNNINVPKVSVKTARKRYLDFSLKVISLFYSAMIQDPGARTYDIPSTYLKKLCYNYHYYKNLIFPRITSCTGSFRIGSKQEPGQCYSYYMAPFKEFIKYVLPMVNLNLSVNRNIFGKNEDSAFHMVKKFKSINQFYEDTLIYNHHFYGMDKIFNPIKKDIKDYFRGVNNSMFNSALVNLCNINNLQNMDKPYKSENNHYQSLIRKPVININKIVNSEGITSENIPLFQAPWIAFTLCCSYNICQDSKHAIDKMEDIMRKLGAEVNDLDKKYDRKRKSYRHRYYHIAEKKDETSKNFFNFIKDAKTYDPISVLT